MNTQQPKPALLCMYFVYFLFFLSLILVIIISVTATLLPSHKPGLRKRQNDNPIDLNGEYRCNFLILLSEKSDVNTFERLVSGRNLLMTDGSNDILRKEEN
jgi:hypothetical protein